MKIIQFTEDITWIAFEKRINEIKEAASKGNIEIHIEGKQKFDPSFLGWLYLFSKEINCKISIKFQITDDNADRFYECLHLFQLLKLSQTEFVEISSFPPFTQKEDTSKDFFPIVPISKGSYNVFFKNSFSDFIKDIDDKIQIDGFWKTFSGDKRENAISNYIKKRLKQEQNLKREYLVRIIFFEHYLQLLSNLNCLKGYAEELTKYCSDKFKLKDLAKNSGINEPGFNEETVKKYWEKLTDFISNKVCTKPPFFVIMFSLIIANFKVKPALNITEADGDLTRIYILTCEYYYRLLELVDNVIEHTKTGNGVILSRVRKKEQAKEMHKDKIGYFDDDRFKDMGDFLEIAVMDISEKGVINTAIEKWKFTKEKEFEDDASWLEKALPEEQIKRFFKPEENYFKHQVLRTSACMGLLMFSQLIDNNNGFFAVETTDLSTGKAIYYTQYLGNSYTTTQATDFRGSKYDIILPVDLKNVKPFVFHEEFYEIPEAKSAIEYVATHDIISLSGKNTVIIGKHQKDEIVIRWNHINYNNYDMNTGDKRTWEDDQANQFINECSNSEFKDKRMIMCLDCEGLTGNNIASLFRITAKIQEKYPSRAIVIFNVSEEVVMLLLDYLKPYIDMSRFWSDTHVIFGLTNYAEPFLIGGKEIQEWLCLNKYLEKYYATSNTIINKIKEICSNKKEKDKAPGKKDETDRKTFNELVDKNPLFIFDKDKNSYVLMPLQWFLKMNGTTVFENRVHNVLINPIPEFPPFYD